MGKTFSIIARLRSFGYAISGIRVMLRTEHNAWIHLLATACVCFLGFLLGVSASEWCLLVLAITCVWVAEAMNTAFEFLADVASPEFHPLVEKAKDVAAGAVLLAAIGAAVVGFLVLGPRLIGWVQMWWDAA